MLRRHAAAAKVVTGAMAVLLAIQVWYAVTGRYVDAVALGAVIAALNAVVTTLRSNYERQEG